MVEGYPDWTEAVLLKGKDPDGNLVIIAVDANGYLTIPLKGDYEGTLTTIMVDEDGRITAYLVDDLDSWGEILKVGNAEQAARLGSPVSWDRRGDVLLAHTFEHGFGQFQSGTGGTGASVALSPLWALSGGYTCLLTGGSDGNRDALIYAGLGNPPSLSVGLAVRFSVGSLPDYLELTLGVYNEGTLSNAQVRYDFDNDRPQYYNSSETWVNLDEYMIETSPHIANQIKLVMDAEAGTYTRLLINTKQYDLTAAMYTVAAAATGNHIYYAIEVQSHSGDNDEVYVDSVVITTNEP